MFAFIIWGFGFLLSLAGASLYIRYSRRSTADWVVAGIAAALPFIAGPMCFLSGLAIVIVALSLKAHRS